MSTPSDWKSLFPQLEKMQAEGLTYFDSAATSLTLKSVANAQYDFDLHRTSNVHRGAHRLSGQATSAYEESREATAKYLNCATDQIVFTHGTTNSLNILANHYSNILKPNEAILLTEMEHHANLLPWQHVAKVCKAQLLFVPVSPEGELDLEAANELLKNNSIKVTSVCHVSNTLGTENPVEELVNLCRQNGSDIIIDGAQAVTSMRPDLAKLDADFYTFSAHKAFGPFGLGILYCKNPNSLSLYQRGGGTVHSVSFDSADFVSGPQRLEPGTPNISGVIALKELFKFLTDLDFTTVQKEERKLLQLAESGLQKLPGYTPVGQSSTRTNILSFNFEGINPTDLCELLDEQGLALRAGHHCTQPLLTKLGHKGCARASFSIYNTPEDVEKLISGTQKALEILR